MVSPDWSTPWQEGISHGSWSDVRHGVAPPGLAAFLGLELKLNCVISSLTKTLSLWSTDLTEALFLRYLVQARTSLS